MSNYWREQINKAIAKFKAAGNTLEIGKNYGIVYSTSHFGTMDIETGEIMCSDGMTAEDFIFESWMDFVINDGAEALPEDDDVYIEGIIAL